MNIDCLFVWIGNPNYGRQAAASVFFFKTRLLQKCVFGSEATHIIKHLIIFGQYWCPQIPLTAELAAPGVFFLKNEMPFCRSTCFCNKLTILFKSWSIVVNICNICQC